jgi:hypothetical protein
MSLQKRKPLSCEQWSKKREFKKDHLDISWDLQQRTLNLETGNKKALTRKQNAQEGLAQESNP